MKGYLFDLDGTLIQSMHVWEDAVMRLFDRLNLKMDIEEAKDAFSAMKFTEVLEALITRFHLPMSVKELYGMVIDDVRRQYAHTVQPVNGAVELLKQCAAAGKRMCVVTANDVPLTEAVLRRIGILQDMEFILSSEESGLTKRTPQMVQEAMRRLRLPAHECVMLEDSLYSMKSAKVAGCYVIAVASPQAKDYAQICVTADEVHVDLSDVTVR